MLRWHLIQTFEQVQVRLCIWFYRWSWTESDDSGAQCHSTVILRRTSMTNSYQMLLKHRHTSDNVKLSQLLLTELNVQVC